MLPLTFIFIKIWPCLFLRLVSYNFKIKIWPLSSSISKGHNRGNYPCMFVVIVRIPANLSFKYLMSAIFILNITQTQCSAFIYHMNTYKAFNPSHFPNCKVNNYYLIISDIKYAGYKQHYKNLVRVLIIDFTFRITC